MANNRFTNIHIHTFNAECAPDNFLRIIPSNFLRRIPKTTKSFLESKTGRFLIQAMAKYGEKKEGNAREAVDKYVAFLEIGTKQRQQQVFEGALRVAEKYSSDARLIALTLNMDTMDDDGPGKKNFNTQLKEVKRIKKYYPRNIFPFLCIDPRVKEGQTLKLWSKKFFENGTRDKLTGEVFPFFSGLKIYPALGFFPFDPRFEEIYADAEKNGIPIMTHCTRVGSQYIGSKIESLITEKPPMMQPEETDSRFTEAQNEINNRISSYIKKGWVKNSKRGDNDLACDLFGHPQNYIPVLLKYPKLKICIAHMGGSNEIKKMMGEKLKEDKPAELDPVSWAQRVKELMVEYPNLYTDISYTLADLDDSSVRKGITDWLNTDDSNSKKLGDRILFGTDYYMTEQEGKESELYQLAHQNLAEWFGKMTRDNCENYLFKKP